MNKIILLMAIIFVLPTTLASCNKDDSDKATWLNPSLTYGSVTDQEGNKYATIRIGNQEWMAENLKTTKYCNGDPIPNVMNNTLWQNLVNGAWVHYNNDSQYDTTYGKLYNWFTVNDSRNVCPCGWHVPTIAEWNLLIDYLGYSEDAGRKMKSAMANDTISPDYQDANNESGFSGLMGGYRFSNGNFYWIAFDGYWWSSSVHHVSNLPWSLWLYVESSIAGLITNHKQMGCSIRCLKD